MERPSASFFCVFCAEPVGIGSGGVIEYNEMTKNGR